MGATIDAGAQPDAGRPITGGIVEGLALRLGRLADSARASGQVHVDDRTARNRAIFEAYGAGWSLAQIAAATGLDKSRVHRIVVEQETRQWQQAAEAIP